MTQSSHTPVSKARLWLAARLIPSLTPLNVRFARRPQKSALKKTPFTSDLKWWRAQRNEQDEPDKHGANTVRTLQCMKHDTIYEDGVYDM